MSYKYLFTSFLIFLTIGLYGKNSGEKGNTPLRLKVKSTAGLVAFWDFNEPGGKKRIASGKGRFPLSEQKGIVRRIDEGPVSGYSALFADSAFLYLPNKKTKQLNIYGKNQGVTVMAWIKWKGQTGFVGGMWNEYSSGGKRQYGLFVSLPYYNGGNQVCGHISHSGKATPPFPYSIDYSASEQIVPTDRWQFIAFTYDGKYIRSYLNGNFVPRAPELIDHTTGFAGYPDGARHSKNPYYFPDGMGNNGSDFTVGAVLLSKGMGNYFRGQIGGLAVFDRALTNEEIKALSEF